MKSLTIVFLFLAASGCGLLQAGRGEKKDAAAPSLTYFKDARSIIDGKCATCHTGAGAGTSLDFRSIDKVQPMASQMAAVIRKGHMPPWQPDNSCNEYLNDRSLSDADKTTLLAWLDAGAPAGDPQYAPPPAPPPAAPGDDLVWDTTIKLPEPYTPKTSPDDYHCFILRWPAGGATRYVTASSFLPDQRQEVHHMLAFAVRKEDEAVFEKLDADEPGPGYTCFGGPTGERGSKAKASMFATWAPGGNVQLQPAGEGFKVEPGQMIVVQMHYNTSTAKPVPDQSALRLSTAASVDRQSYSVFVADPKWLKKGGMVIPAGAPDTRFESALDLSKVLEDLAPGGDLADDQPFEVSRVGLHMHTRGQAAELSVLRADGRKECLVRIADWDFHWQEGYNLRHPVVVRPGDKINLKCQFDNSGKPSDHDSGPPPTPKTIEWGEGTGDEMCLGVMLIARPAPGGG